MLELFSWVHESDASLRVVAGVMYDQKWTDENGIILFHTSCKAKAMFGIPAFVESEFN